MQLNVFGRCAMTYDEIMNGEATTWAFARGDLPKLGPGRRSDHWDQRNREQRITCSPGLSAQKPELTCEMLNEYKRRFFGDWLDSPEGECHP